MPVARRSRGPPGPRVRRAAYSRACRTGGLIGRPPSLITAAIAPHPPSAPLSVGRLCSQGAQQRPGTGLGFPW